MEEQRIENLENGTVYCECKKEPEWNCPIHGLSVEIENTQVERRKKSFDTTVEEDAEYLQCLAIESTSESKISEAKENNQDEEDCVEEQLENTDTEQEIASDEDSETESKDSLVQYDLPSVPLLPNNLAIRLSNISEAGYGIWSVNRIPENTLFGPLEFDVIVSDVEEVGKREEEQIYNNDGKKECNSDWMHHINVATTSNQKNLTSLWSDGRLYYKTIKTIPPQTELLLSFEDKVNTEMEQNENPNCVKLSKELEWDSALNNATIKTEKDQTEHIICNARIKHVICDNFEQEYCNSINGNTGLTENFDLRNIYDILFHVNNSDQMQNHFPSERTSKDENILQMLNIPFSSKDIISIPYEEFSAVLSKYKFNDRQLSLIRDIRRRGRNKYAAQRCRQRKLGEIFHLREELDTLFKIKTALQLEQKDMLTVLHDVRSRYKQLYILVSETISQSLKTSDFYQRFSLDEIYRNIPGSSEMASSSNFSKESNKDE